MPTESYIDFLHERLRDPEYAAGYLTECYEDSLETFLLGLKHVVEANGGFSSIADASSLSREHLYKMLSEDGNPRISSLGLILKTLGLRLQITPEEQKEAA